MKITKFTTFYKIDFDEKNRKRELYYSQDLMNALSTINYATEEQEPFCYILGEKNLRVPRGVGDTWLMNKLGVYGTIHEGPTFPYDSTKYFNINKKPFPEQMKVIYLSLKAFKAGHTQVIIDMPTGRGKTFTATAIASELGCNILVLVKTEVLLNQWAGEKGSFVNHTKLRPRFICAMRGSKWFMSTYEENLGYKIFVTTHATLRSIIDQQGSPFITEWCIKNKIGLKIFDEFDTEVDSMLKLDFITSVRYNLYLSATTFKNGQYDDAAFQKMIKDIPKYGKDFYVEKPNRIAYIYGFKSEPTREDRKTCYNYKGKFVPDKHMALNMKSQGFWNTLKDIVKTHAMPIYEMDKGHKIVIMCGKIENCKIVKDFLIENFNIPLKHIAEFHSEVPKGEKELALTKPFIISITDSIGRGLDISKIKLTIDMETYAGGSIFKQATGRNGRVGGETGIYIKAIDKSFMESIRYYKKLHKFFDEEFKMFKEINISKHLEGEDRK